MGNLKKGCRRERKKMEEEHDLKGELGYKSKCESSIRSGGAIHGPVGLREKR